ncbi:MAG TPA: DUF554 domain-containing protein [Firmicutes bacterium]|nr:DUF554 domain-containing protein [Bacillota bacterium]
MVGTLLNAGTVVLGGTAGTLLGSRLPEQVRTIVMDALGLTTVLIGLKMALQTTDVLLVLGSLLLGGIAGELLNLDGLLNRLGKRLEERVQVRVQERVQTHTTARGQFARGFVSASLLFCVGPMTIMGSIQDGLTGDYSTLAIKAMLDGFAALAFASSLGLGVVFSALVVLTYQGAITLLAGYAQSLLTTTMITEMTATGGLLIFAIGLGLLQVKSIRVANLLPAIFLAPLLTAFFG